MKKIVITLFFVFSVLWVSAQKQEHEFSIYAGGGFAAFCFQPTIKNASSMGYGGDAGVGFTGFISSNWGIHTGIGVGFFNVINTVNSFVFVTHNKIICGYPSDLHTTLSDYKETHKTIFLTVPLMLQFQTTMEQYGNRKKGKKVGYYAMTGVKAQCLFNYKYTSEIASLNNKAYFPEFNSWLTSFPSEGVGSFNGNNASGKLKFNILAMFALETGAKWRIGDKLFLYTGVYFDCGLHDFTKKYRKRDDYYTSHEQLKELTLLKFTDRMNLITIGIKLRLGIKLHSGFSKSQKNGCHYSYR